MTAVSHLLHLSTSPDSSLMSELEKWGETYGSFTCYDSGSGELLSHMLDKRSQPATLRAYGPDRLALRELRNRLLPHDQVTSLRLIKGELTEDFGPAVTQAGLALYPDLSPACLTEELLLRWASYDSFFLAGESHLIEKARQILAKLHRPAYGSRYSLERAGHEHEVGFVVF